MTPIRWARDPDRFPEWRYIKTGLVWLCEFIKEQTPIKTVIEVGSYAGESTEIFADYFGHSTIHAVDHFMDPIDAPVPSDVEESFDIRMNRAGNIVKHRLFSPAGAYEFEDGSADLIYIDADHRHDAVLADIRAWWPKLKAGRFFGGHDYNNPDVAAAVRDFFGDPYQMGLITFPDFSWIVWKP